MANQHLFEFCLDEMVRNQASDLYINIDSKPILRVNDILVPLELQVLDKDDINGILDYILNEEQESEFQATLELNVAYSNESKERFRINIYMQKSHPGLVIRRISAEIPVLSDIGAPEIYKNYIMKKRGLFIISGSSGCGKSTSIAAMINHRNQNGSGHIIVLEDPIEYYHNNINSIITQREVGIDTYSYGIALKNALRQRPDVIVIGEIRDRETLENCILFCETGHLVLATIHANNANHAVERMVNLFPKESHRQVLLTLSGNLNAISSQRLITGKKREKVLAHEIMINKGLIRNYIEEGKIKEIKEIMERSRDQGMITFDQHLYDLYKRNIITSEEAIANSDNPGNLGLKLNNDNFDKMYEKSAKKGSGKISTDDGF